MRRAAGIAIRASMRPGPTVREGVYRTGILLSKPIRASMRPGPTVREGTGISLAGIAIVFASMRPGPTVREGETDFGSGEFHFFRFNEARTNGPGRWLPPSPENITADRFNEARTNGPGRSRQLAGDELDSPRLQ